MLEFHVRRESVHSPCISATTSTRPFNLRPGEIFSVEKQRLAFQFVLFSGKQALEALLFSVHFPCLSSFQLFTENFLCVLFRETLGLWHRLIDGRDCRVEKTCGNLYDTQGLGGWIVPFEDRIHLYRRVRVVRASVREDPK